MTSLSSLTPVYKEDGQIAITTPLPLERNKQKLFKKSRRTRQRCMIMKSVFALVVLLHLCDGSTSDMGLNSEIIIRLNRLNTLFRSDKVVLVSITHWYMFLNDCHNLTYYIFSALWFIQCTLSPQPDLMRLPNMSKTPNLVSFAPVQPLHVDFSCYVEQSSQWHMFSTWSDNRYIPFHCSRPVWIALWRTWNRFLTMWRYTETTSIFSMNFRQIWGPWRWVNR